MAEAFANKTAIITGGASGIGRALGSELAALGARVVLADIDGDEARRTAAALSGQSGSAVVEGRQLDVREREKVQALVDDVVASHGSIDFYFNNAGISLGGPTHEFSGPHWDRIIDVNLVGVVNGLLAAYPAMIRQGRGHIINVASGAGLVAPPFVVAYAATKHAVVGLSTGLRPEAALHGVRVSVVCPGAVDTPILDRLPDSDLPPTTSAPVTPRRYLTEARQRPVAADRFARAALKGVAANRGIIVVPPSAKSLWYLNRLSPTLVERATSLLAKQVARSLVRPALPPAGQAPRS
jgi:NAD(P)-dependent dehydrogenase (short-subunit alcohol dehydrogenase family)